MEIKRSDSWASRGSAAETSAGLENAVPQLSAEMARRDFLKFAGSTQLALSSILCAHADGPSAKRREFIMEFKQVDVAMVAPALEKYARGSLSDLWKRPGLAPRDRSIVTIAALIARNQTTEMPYHVSLAIDNGVKPQEISEAITHLAFYSGWGNAMAAVAVVKDVFAARKIGADQLPSASPKLLQLDETTEAKRAARVEQQFGEAAPGVVQYTADLLFRDLWLRPELVPRDRSLVTVSALIASGQVAQVSYHLNRAMDNGLTQAQAAEVLTHLAFYAGWPNVFSALPVAKEVFERRRQ
jgi:4-carboxymuconolactone decarboxylase